MGAVRKADFYYGAMLSFFINNGLDPAIFESNDDRRIYDITSDKDYKIYAKYLSSPNNKDRKNKDRQLWNFSFLPDEIEFIKNYDDEKSIYFAFICGREKLQESEIVILTHDEVKKCLDVDYARSSHRLSIKWEKGTHGLKAYGTGLDSNDSIRISRDILTYFREEFYGT